MQNNVKSRTVIISFIFLRGKFFRILCCENFPSNIFWNESTFRVKNFVENLNHLFKMYCIYFQCDSRCVCSAIGFDAFWFTHRYSWKNSVAYCIKVKINHSNIISSSFFTISNSNFFPCFFLFKLLAFSCR